MAERDKRQTVPLNSDVPGDREKLRLILAQWGLEEASIRRVLRECPAPGGKNSNRDSQDRQDLKSEI